MRKRILYIILGLLVALFIIFETLTYGFGQEQHQTSNLRNQELPAFNLWE